MQGNLSLLMKEAESENSVQRVQHLFCRALTELPVRLVCLPNKLTKLPLLIEQ